MRKKTPLFFLIFLTFIGFSTPLRAQNDSGDAFRSTAFPLPRFVSLGSDEIYVRTGPGQRYPIKLVYKKKGLPVEVILEYEAWRKIRDQDGDIGWVHKSLLSGQRTGLIRAEDMVSVYRKPKLDARLVAYIEPQTLGNISQCKQEWCEFESSGYKGWLQRKYVWGVYENEDFD